MKAFGLVITTDVLQEENVHHGLEYAWVQLLPAGKLSGVEVQLRLEGKPGEVVTFTMYMGTDYSVPFKFNIPVEWNGDLANTRTKNQEGRWRDNADVILVDALAYYDDIQVAVVTPDGKHFFLTAQVVFRGHARIVDGEPVFIPAMDYFNYPENNYGRTWDRMGRMVGRLTEMIQVTTENLGGTLQMPEAPKWHPTFTGMPRIQGKVRSAIAYYNPITMTGMAVGEDGVHYHVEANNLRRVKGLLKMVEPAALVYLQPGQRREGYTLTPVLSCTPYQPN